MKPMLLPQLSRNPAVLTAIDEELTYINELPYDRSRADMMDHGVAGQILVAEEYLGRAREAWVTKAGEMHALDNLRKVAAICTRALIAYGCPRRLP